MEGLAVQQAAEQSSSDSEEDVSSVLFHEAPRILSKSQKRRLKAAAQEMSESFRTEAKAPQNVTQETFASAKQAPRRSGPWRMLEIFALTCAVTCSMTKAAINRNWQGFEPVVESRWNMTQEEQRSKANDYMNQVEPDLVIVNLPPYPWQHANQRINKRTRPRHRKLLALRERQRQRFLKTTYEISKWCQHSGCV